MPAATRLHEMSNTAFAGFLRLLLTPLDEIPSPSRELEAYLEYLNQTSPATPAENWAGPVRLDVPTATADLPFRRAAARLEPASAGGRNRLAHR